MVRARSPGRAEPSRAEPGWASAAVQGLGIRAGSSLIRRDLLRAVAQAATG